VSGYLKRLATRGLGEQGAAPVVPLVRSRSPIAEEDQRIGIPGFGTPDVGNVTSSDTWEASSFTPSQLSSRTPMARSAGRGMLQRKATSHAGAREFSTPKFDMATPGIAIRDGGVTTADIGLSDQPATSKVRTRTTSLDNDQRNAFRQAGGMKPTVSKISPTPRAPAGLGETRSPSPNYDYPVDEPESGQQRNGEAAPQRLEPLPRAVLVPEPHPMSSADLDPTATHRQDPSVFIGRINVEVIQAAVEPKTSTASRPGPLTAASVSVIGPLTRDVRSDLRLSLRHR
jgi:hypothetical protein